VRLRFRGFGRDPLSLSVEVAFAADFADMFDVRAAGPGRERPAVSGAVENGGLRFDYDGTDGERRSTAIALEPQPEEIHGFAAQFTARWPMELQPGSAHDVHIVVAPAAEAGPVPDFDEVREGVRESHREWVGACTALHTDNEEFERLVAASMRDLRVLLTPIEGADGVSGQISAAGIPWFVAPFGRDSLITAYESLPIQPDLARSTLLLLAALQATDDDPWRDAEPGKILHEMRFGELAAAGLVPHTPYYGAIDSTPLFVILAAAYNRWTNDQETLVALLPAIDSALEWIDRHGDADGDGFVEYERRSPGGLVHQGWKDSEDAIVDADGRLAEGPIALCEVQAYVYMAKLRAAEIYDGLGDPARGRSLRADAAALRDAFHDAFWNPDEGTFALALDGRKRQVASVTSNAGHCLFSGIVSERRAAAVVERLMADDMFTGWGIRTLAGGNPSFNPMSYHCGSVWPHDNAIIAAGFKRYGYAAEAQRVASALFDVARGAVDHRLPELYCGFPRRSSAPVEYAVACTPQAWAAASPFLLLQAMLGISADAPNGTLTVHEPLLPDWLGEVEVRNLRVGDSRIGLHFRADRGATAFSLLETSGSVRVSMTG
jgi:glycogen debranching enzyme